MSSQKTISTSKVFSELHKDPEYVAEYEALENEFELASQFIKARNKAKLTQSQLAERMKTSQAFIARLESGKEKPSTRTLERFAEATQHRLSIRFEERPNA